VNEREGDDGREKEIEGDKGRTTMVAFAHCRWWQ